MNERPIATVAWGLPDGWVHWRIGDLVRAEAEVAAIETDEITRAAALAAVEAFDAMVHDELPGTTFAALWTPGAGVRRPLASATLRVAPAPETGRMNVETLLTFVRDRATAGRGARLLDVAALPSRVTAGDAVLRIVDRSPRFRRQVSRTWTWFILPSGSGCTIACQLESSAITRFDELADMATDIANSVVVTLEST